MVVYTHITVDWMKFLYRSILFVVLTQLFAITNIATANDFIDFSFLVVEASPTNIKKGKFWSFIKENKSIAIELDVTEQGNTVVLKEETQDFFNFLYRINNILEEEQDAVIPIFLHYKGNVNTLDSLINLSAITDKIFHLPLGEAWPTTEYLIQANRRVIFFISGDYIGESRILHKLDNYVLRISGDDVAGTRATHHLGTGLNPELFMIDDLDKLPVRSSQNITNLVPDYINYLLENWTLYGKKPNFLFIGENFNNYDITLDQLNSFSWISGTVKYAGKNLEKIYWKNPVVTVTNGKFSFPIRGGEELILSPFSPGFEMSPRQVVVTGEMEVPESYSIMATPIELSEGLSGSFSFEDDIENSLNPSQIYVGENYSFTQDIERGNVLKLPDKSNINLGSTETYGLRNSSFTVSCFVKFNEILEFGDNAIIGNNRSGYRKGFHLILRSGHPYFGLWANDYISDEVLKPNIWYHLVWRYIIETGEQAIFLNGKNIGSSDGHPPFSGTGDIHVGSALSSSTSLRGYIDDLYFWSRPLGIEEINRLALNEDIKIQANKEKKIRNKEGGNIKWVVGFLVFLLMLLIVYIIVSKIKTKKYPAAIHLPLENSANQVRLFGKFLVVDKDSIDISDLFTPKVKELFLFILTQTVKNINGANVNDVNETLWPGISSKKVANNRAVTLNKLRRILNRLEGVEIVTQNGFLLVKTGASWFCDFFEASKLCKNTGGVSKTELEAFFELVKGGRLLKETEWPWLDEIRGHTGNQVIDNLLKLATIYFKENKLDKIDAVSRRILDYDDMSEEAVYMQVMVLQKTNNMHLAKFNFKSFQSKYKENMGEDYSFNFDGFCSYYSKLLQF